ncbi:hypothetical protein MMC30_005198 [Trapelia coarctata]|nr:hypothetical protein [Trapelia coarctata]
MFKQRAHGEAIDEHSAEIDGGPLVNTTSVFFHIEQGLRKNPHGAAVICMHQPADHLSALVPADNEFQQQNGVLWDKPQNGVNKQQNGSNRIKCLTLTYTQVHRAAQKLAGGMMANGAQPDSTVLMLIPNGGEYTLLLWTCIIMRLTFVCVDPSALDASAFTELRNTLRTLKPSLVVVPDAAGAKAVDIAVLELRLPPPVRICLDSGTSNDWRSLLDLAADAPNSPVDEDTLLEAARNDDLHRVHSILFTSGTSGSPKGCPLRVGGMTHVLHSQSWLIDKDNCALALQQAHNSRGIAPAQTLQTWREGGAVVMSGKGFAIEDIVDAILGYGVTFIVLTPAMVHTLGQELASRPLNVNSVRSIQVGGDAVTKDTMMKCAALFPHAKVCINHGMTEGGGSFTWPFFDTPIPRIPYFGEICPIGAVAPGSIVRIWNADRTSVSKKGEPGELHVCCDSIIRHYLGGTSESSFYEDKKGRWFNTGDIAMMDTEGLVFILGRSKDMIKRAAVAIMPAAIESCIEKYTGAQTSVVAVPHRSLGHEPFAVLSDFNGKNEAEIKNHVLLTLGKDYALGGLLSLRQIGLDKFPVNATHKIMKSEVQSAAIAHINRAKE